MPGVKCLLLWPRLPGIRRLGPILRSRSLWSRLGERREGEVVRTFHPSPSYRHRLTPRVTRSYNCPVQYLYVEEGPESGNTRVLLTFVLSRYFKSCWSFSVCRPLTLYLSRKLLDHCHVLPHLSHEISQTLKDRTVEIRSDGTFPTPGLDTSSVCGRGPSVYPTIFLPLRRSEFSKPKTLLLFISLGRCLTTNVLQITVSLPSKINDSWTMYGPLYGSGKRHPSIILQLR